MSRWRPAAAPSTAIISAAGYQRLERELNELWKERRPDIVQALAAAAAEGDRSENAEYIYRKKQLAEMDRRVRYLSRRIPVLKVVAEPPTRRDAVFFGATVTLGRLADGGSECHTLVGPDEIDARRGRISIDSPLARALLGKRVDDELEVHRPGGNAAYRIIAIDYDEQNGTPDSNNGTRDPGPGTRR